MKILKTVLAALIVLGAINTKAQKIKVIDGDLDFLKGQKEIMLEYDYSDMAVGKFDIQHAAVRFQYGKGIKLSFCIAIGQ